MIALKHILAPTDFSDPSQVAMKYARALAENFAATLHVLHVFDDSHLLWVASEGFPIDESGNLREEAERAARDRLQRVVAEAQSEKHPTRAILRVGAPFVEIIRYAREENIDLIVMGTHGRGPIAHLLMGSVAERVVRKAPCPVLTVRHPEHEFVLP
jgi:nucleotide-binding universal stress UspA family protein